MATCERCGYLGAGKNWCARCATIDPFPRRRWIVRGVIAAMAVLAALAIYLIPRELAKAQASEIAARAKSFSAPRESKLTPSANNRR